MIPNRQKGKHTWDLNYRCHRCPNCGFIIEDRENYEYHAGKYLKHLQCTRCNHEFTDEITPNSLGSIFGR